MLGFAEPTVKLCPYQVVDPFRPVHGLYRIGLCCFFPLAWIPAFDRPSRQRAEVDASISHPPCARQKVSQHIEVMSVGHVFAREQEHRSQRSFCGLLRMGADMAGLESTISQSVGCYIQVFLGVLQPTVPFSDAILLAHT